MFVYMSIKEGSYIIKTCVRKGNESLTQIISEHIDFEYPMPSSIISYGLLSQLGFWLRI